MMTTQLSVEGVTKAFDGQLALDDVDLDLRPGEIHALLGQNGSGKSTLIKILAGYHQPSSYRRATADGVGFELGSAAAAHALGVHFIHQDLGLVTEMNAADNIALTDEWRRPGWLSHRRERRRIMELCREHGVSVDPSIPVERLTAAERTMIAVVRALYQARDNSAVLVLDEPTATLPDHEVEHLFDLLRRLRARGTAILYVTHRLAEVFQLADRVTVFRDGRVVGTEATSQLDQPALMRMILGRDVEHTESTEHAEPSGEPVLTVRGVRGHTVEDVSFTLARGECLGVTGLVGSGYEHLLRLVVDASARRSGIVELAGEGPIASVHHAVRRGIGYVPADRQSVGSIPAWTARENLTLPALRPHRLTRWLGLRDERQDAHAWLSRLGAVPQDSEAMLAAFSGGNQQKVLVARWLRSQAKVYLLEEPTNGVDVGARRALYALLDDLVAAGGSVLVSSSDAEELCAICDRVIVMRGGTIAAVISRDELDVARLRHESQHDDDRGRHSHSRSEEASA